MKELSVKELSVKELALNTIDEARRTAAWMQDKLNELEEMINDNRSHAIDYAILRTQFEDAVRTMMHVCDDVERLHSVEESEKEMKALKQQVVPFTGWQELEAESQRQFPENEEPFPEDRAIEVIYDYDKDSISFYVVKDTNTQHEMSDNEVRLGYVQQNLGTESGYGAYDWCCEAWDKYIENIYKTH